MYSYSSLDTASAPNEALTCERRPHEDAREARACCNYLMISQPVTSSTGAPRHSARLKSLERLSTDHIVSLTRVFERRDDARARLPKPQAALLLHCVCVTAYHLCIDQDRQL